MAYLLFPGTQLQVSRLVLGTGGFGTHLPADASISMLDRYRDLGGNFIDTANVYGRWAPEGEPTSERLIGRWLNDGVRRDQLVLATKGGCPPLNDMKRSRLSRADIRHDLEDSLKNLGTDYIDLYWLHHDDPQRPVDDIFATLDELRSEGKIRYFGVSNWSSAREREILRYGRDHASAGVRAIQKMWNVAKPNRWRLDKEQMTFFEGGDAEVLSEFEIPLVCYSSQAQGYFSARADRHFLDDDRFRTPREFFENSRSRQVAEVVDEIARRYGVSPTEVALVAILVSQVAVWPIIGPSSGQELAGSFSSMAIELGAADTEELRRCLFLEAY